MAKGVLKLVRPKGREINIWWGRGTAQLLDRTRGESNTKNREVMKVTVKIV